MARGDDTRVEVEDEDENVEDAEGAGSVAEALQQVQLGEGGGDPEFGLQSDEQKRMVQEALQQLGSGSASATGSGNALQQAMTSALQEQLNSLVGQSSGFVESLSQEVQDRIGELRSLQEQRDQLHAEFLREKRELELKYETKEQPLYDKRAKLVSGDEDVPHENVSRQQSELEQGVPDFWLCVLRNCEEVGEYISERDEDALKYLTDIRAHRLTGEDERGFSLYFYFQQPNPYFSNECITKTYYMADEEDPVMDHADATPINWHSGKDLTVKVMRKKSKTKSGKTIVKREKAESFFNFFKPPEVPSSANELDEKQMQELQSQMEQDYEMGAAIRDKVVPDALRWFTGEAIEAGESDAEEDEEDEDDDVAGEFGDEDEEDDEDEDDSEAPGDTAETGQQQCAQQ